MQGSRVPTGVFRKKSRVILDKRFPFVNNLELGDKGQIRADLEVQRSELRMEEDGNEMKVATLLITKAELIDFKDTRST